jgi:malate/lactate dehydrogenase
MNKENESAREYYLKEFKRENKPAMLDENIQKVGARIVEVMKKEDFTYDQAYASLQYAYNLIRYQSNFLKLS